MFTSWTFTIFIEYICEMNWLKGIQYNFQITYEGYDNTGHASRIQLNLIDDYNAKIVKESIYRAQQLHSK